MLSADTFPNSSEVAEWYSFNNMSLLDLYYIAPIKSSLGLHIKKLKGQKQPKKCKATKHLVFSAYML